MNLNIACAQPRVLSSVNLEFGSKPTETQKYNIENQVLGGRQMEGRRELFLYL